MILDVHNHYYPPEYLDELKKGQSTITVDEDAEGNPRVHYPGDYNIVVKGHRDIDYRQDILDQLGITRQVITFTTPGVHVERPALSVQWATLVNDCLGKIARERSKHFSALATLPLNDPAASVIELERAMKEHGLPGAMLFSNVNGVPLADARYLPLYQKADELGAVLHIHPMYPLGVEAMKEVLADAAGRVPDGHHAGQRRTWCSPACPSASRASSGCSATSAAPFPIWPSGSIAATRPSPSAARTSPSRRPST